MIIYPGRHPLSSIRFDPTGISEVLAIVAALSATAGLVTSISAASNTPKSPSVTSPTPPSQTNAEQTAEAAQAQQRKEFLATGGQTDYTGGLGILTGSNLQQSTLTGT